jgi:hypothetical protein
MDLPRPDTLAHSLAVCQGPRRHLFGTLAGGVLSLVVDCITHEASAKKEAEEKEPTRHVKGSQVDGPQFDLWT